LKQKVIIIGAGFSSLSAACYLAKKGYEVQILEKNEQLGGRARQMKRDGFTFDIGPTFYWMPDVFESFFNDFGKNVNDYYALKKLNPAYQVYFGKNDSISIPDNLEEIKEEFEKIEKGSSQKLAKFIDNAAENYNIAINDLVYKPGENIFEIIALKTLKRLPLFFKSIKFQVSQYFRDPRLIKIMEFPVLFLGAKPSNTPAFYNFMNYADFALGTWHPEGGMYKDILLSGADYAHTESLLDKKFRSYSPNYWNKKTFAPSALLFYVGFDKKLKNVSHHTLFFDTDFGPHADAIYDNMRWPEKPLFYASFPGITDSLMSPTGKESGVFLIPIAPDLEDTPEIRKKYFDIIIDRIETMTHQKLKNKILFQESYCIKEFVSDYNSYKGNAYGLANTIWQTHILRPKLRSKKLKNLYFAGQLTVPGPGVPPSIISGKIVSELIHKYHERDI